MCRSERNLGDISKKQAPSEQHCQERSTRNRVGGRLTGRIAALWLQASLLKGDFEQVIIMRSLTLISEDSIGAHDPPKLLWSIRIAGIFVRMVRVGGLTECGSEALSVVVRKCTE